MSIKLCSSSLLYPTFIVSFHNPSLLSLSVQVRKRQRLKKSFHRWRRMLPLRCSVSTFFDGLAHSLISAFPSVNSIELLIPTLGFASGAALYLSSNNRWEEFLSNGSEAAGDWVLFASPTPFNRSILFRCPSLSFSDAENFVEAADSLSIGKDRHYVTGKIPWNKGGDLQLGTGLSYQRTCVPMDDGGVISLDWPENLDLDREYGLDTTVVLVPGTPEGSMDQDVMALVLVALRCGFFPVVMNPRGCASSPVTTPRLFTAADSDDLCTVIQFMKRVRPLSTLMSIGLGYGANVLTKYLSESGGKTPITAASCINNPFDIEEATKSNPYNVSLDKKLTGSLIQILQANKEIFQGKGKGFNLTRALSATSVRDFDESISMISHGFEFVEDFYARCNTRQVVHDVKIPLLYIQSDNSSVPLLSIPRNSIEENPFTSLLMCSSLPTNSISAGRSSMIWCAHLVIEWLQAVELALLKGRHPLLDDVDIPLKPPSEGILSWNKNGKKFFKSSSREQFIQNNEQEDMRSYVQDPVRSVNGDSMFTNIQDGSTYENVDIEAESVNGFKQNKLSDIGNRTGMDERESGHVLATAEVILDMLDHTMPGSLPREQKKKVLTAMEQGDTLMKALETAVPEDVREKLSKPLSDIMHVHGRSLNLEKFTRIGGNHVKRRGKRAENMETSAGVETSEKGEAQSNLEADSKENTSAQIHHGDNSKGGDESFPVENNIEGNAFAVSDPAVGEKKPVLNGTDKNENLVKDECEREIPKETRGHVMKQNDDIAEETEDVNNRPANGKVGHNSSESASSVSSNPVEILFPSPNDLEVQTSHHDTQNSKSQLRQEKFDPNVESSSKSADSPPSSSINVSEALVAFQSFDDSTQKAVNSVFGVIENVIDQLEKKTDGDGVERKNEDEKLADAPPKSLANDHHSDEMKKEGLKLEMEHDDESPGKCEDISVGQGKPLHNIMVEQHNIKRLNSSTKNFLGFLPGANKDFNYPQVGNSDKVGVYDFPGYLSNTAFWESSYREYLQRYFLLQISNQKSSELQPATDLFLDTERGQWKMLDQVENSKYSSHNVTESLTTRGSDADQHTVLQEVDKEEIIDTSYVIIDNEQPLKQSTEEQLPSNEDKKDFVNVSKERLIWLVKHTIVDSLKVEVRRKLGMSEMDNIEPVLATEMDAIACSVALSLLSDNNLALSLKENDCAPEKIGTVQGKLIVDSISSALRGAGHLKRVIPMGVIVGTSLASLGRFFNISDTNDDKVDTAIPRVNAQQNSNNRKSDEKCSYDQHIIVDNMGEVSKEVAVKDTRNKNVMAGAVAILGASALLSHQENINHGTENRRISSASVDGKPDVSMLQDKKAKEEDGQQDIVDSLAEKAISMATSPVVPSKIAGEIDHERLLSIFSELGQKGGLLKFFGNIALLWGGIRGAMSLADRLIRFLHVAERPLIYRVVGFACMILVIWSPVAIPLLPHILQSWTIKSSMGIAGYACLIGLHVSVLLMIILWGKRIRGYESPLDQYGLNMSSSSKVPHFIKGLVGGIFFVIVVHSVNVWLGYAYISRSHLSLSSSSTAKLVKAYGNFIFLSLRGFITSTVISVVEELLFRSWLPDEIAADLSYHQSILISALAFAVFQRSLPAIPGFLFLSLALLGAKQKSEGSLFVPIGARVGIMFSSFILQNNGLLSYGPQTPPWFRSSNQWHPFDGVLGLICSILVAIFLYPWQDAPQLPQDAHQQTEKA